MVTSVNGNAALSTAMLSGSQCRGSRDTQALQEKLFSKLDVNGDGSIDQSELSQFVDFASSSGGTAASGDSSAADLFKSLDTNGDGTLSKTELSDGTKKLFDELRTQLMTTQSASADATAAGGTQGPPPGGGHHHHGGGFFSKVSSLLDQYRSSGTDAGTSGGSSTLSVAA